jgi:hypothetical protein
MGKGRGQWGGGWWEEEEKGVSGEEKGRGIDGEGG